ncbi:hypothetical protein PPL_04780 [Heterostelium album PN500]|uniref:Ubiquitin-like domain-containing protein n=1 Tax=Heterostelium pallidum (strain ATCC 26659 / Pp 5 / PN500) TaxID=670386 RepID=D3B8I7_HETP5|nr:hypothetical protein PPL_04780 [Heterostelium album PN500]EFA82355.1 hypothetical protein PPL_04780 [Heterostelium album PN500]|eukprot:XP_020434472.1 hypothetical protein PPL_04780 [Heterostelium album PN500]
MKITLHLQACTKKFENLEFDDQSTVKQLIKHLSNLGFAPNFDREQKSDVCIVIQDTDVVLDSSCNDTLQQSNIRNGEHLYVSEKSDYRPDGSCILNFRQMNGDITTLENISYSQSMKSVTKLLAEKLNQPEKNIRLIFAGKIMDIYRTVSNSSLQTQSTIHLVLRVPKTPTS